MGEVVGNLSLTLISIQMFEVEMVLFKYFSYHSTVGGGCFDNFLSRGRFENFLQESYALVFLLFTTLRGYYGLIIFLSFK